MYFVVGFLHFCSPSMLPFKMKPSLSLFQPMPSVSYDSCNSHFDSIRNQTQLIHIRVWISFWPLRMNPNSICWISWNWELWISLNRMIWIQSCSWVHPRYRPSCVTCFLNVFAYMSFVFTMHNKITIQKIGLPIHNSNLDSVILVLTLPPNTWFLVHSFLAIVQWPPVDAYCLVIHTPMKHLQCTNLSL